MLMKQLAAFASIVAHCDWCGKPKTLFHLHLTPGGMLCHRCYREMPRHELDRLRKHEHQ